MRTTIKKVAVSTLLSGAAVFAQGVGVANADTTQPSPTTPNSQAGLVNVLLNNVVVNANVNVDAAAAVVANLCGLDLPSVNALVYQVSQSGAPVTACQQSNGAVTVTKSA